jgi:hypothetical protein
MGRVGQLVMTCRPAVAPASPPGPSFIPCASAGTEPGGKWSRRGKSRPVAESRQLGGRSLANKDGALVDDRPLQARVSVSSAACPVMG